MKTYRLEDMTAQDYGSWLARSWKGWESVEVDGIPVSCIHYETGQVEVSACGRYLSSVPSGMGLEDMVRRILGVGRTS